MNHKKSIMLLSALICVFSANVSFADERPNEDIGGFHIRQNPEIKVEKDPIKASIDEIKSKEEEFHKNRIGDLSVIKENEPVRIGRKKRPKDTSEMSAIKETLTNVVELANAKQYNMAIWNLKLLTSQHPEFTTLQKWIGVYQNLNGEYIESESTFEALKLGFPLSDSIIQKDNMIRYYELDNMCHNMYMTKEAKLAKVKEFEDYIEKLETGHVLEGIPESEILDMLCEYQRFLINYESEKFIDHEKLDALWNFVPKEKKNHLDDFYGYNIDELTFIYAKHYNRKDLLKTYVTREKTSTNKTVQEHVREAKQILAQ